MSLTRRQMSIPSQQHKWYGSSLFDLNISGSSFTIQNQNSNTLFQATGSSSILGYQSGNSTINGNVYIPDLENQLPFDGNSYPVLANDQVGRIYTTSLLPGSVGGVNYNLSGLPDNTLMVTGSQSYGGLVPIVAGQAGGSDPTGFTSINVPVAIGVTSTYLPYQLVGSSDINIAYDNVTRTVTFTASNILLQEALVINSDLAIATSIPAVAGVISIPVRQNSIVVLGSDWRYVEFTVSSSTNVLTGTGIVIQGVMQGTKFDIDIVTSLGDYYTQSFYSNNPYNSSTIGTFQNPISYNASFVPAAEAQVEVVQVTSLANTYNAALYLPLGFNNSPSPGILTMKVRIQNPLPFKLPPPSPLP